MVAAGLKTLTPEIQGQLALATSWKDLDPLVQQRLYALSKRCMDGDFVAQWAAAKGPKGAVLKLSLFRKWAEGMGESMVATVAETTSRASLQESAVTAAWMSELDLMVHFKAHKSPELKAHVEALVAKATKQGKFRENPNGKEFGKVYRVYLPATDADRNTTSKSQQATVAGDLDDRDNGVFVEDILSKPMWKAATAASSPGASPKPGREKAKAKGKAKAQASPSKAATAAAATAAGGVAGGASAGEASATVDGSASAGKREAGRLLAGLGNRILACRELMQAFRPAATAAAAASEAVPADAYGQALHDNLQAALRALEVAREALETSGPDKKDALASARKASADFDLEARTANARKRAKKS